MMKKKILAIGALVLLVGGFFLWVYHQDATRVEAKVEYSQMNFTITTIETDVEGLAVEAKIECTEGESGPSLVLYFTNNGKENMTLGESTAYYKQGEKWKKVMTGQYFEDLIGYVVLSMDTVEKMQSQLEDPSMVSNTLTHGYCLWDKYLSMDKLREYRFELEICGDGGSADKFGTVWVEWTQELK